MAWKRRYGDTIEIRAQNMFSKDWNIPATERGRNLPMKKIKIGDTNVLFDKIHHRFFENFNRRIEAGRDPRKLICLSQRYCEQEAPEPDFYEIEIDSSIYNFMKSAKTLQRVRALRCTCASNRKAPSRLRSGTRCKHILLFEKLKEHYLRNQPRQWQYSRSVNKKKSLLL